MSPEADTLWNVIAALDAMGAALVELITDQPVERRDAALASFEASR
jgi:hypothetical protein